MKINLAHLAVAADVLGPGRRAVIWVQGCHRRCYNCITPDMQPFIERELVAPEELVGRVLALGDLEGITLVGGEPFEQAQGLSEFIVQLKERSHHSVFTYSGYTLAELQQRQDPWWDKLLALSDVLVDGLYVEALACDLLWRGSRNQQIHLLSDRYRALAPILNLRGRRLEFSITRDGRLVLIGIPAPDFFAEFGRRMAERGIMVRSTTDDDDTGN